MRFNFLTGAALAAIILLLVSAVLNDDVLIRLTRGLKDFEARRQQVKIYLSFNQSVYSPGDTAYFSVHFLRANDLGPVGGRQILNLEVTDSVGRLVIRKWIAIQSGFGHNQLAIPPTLPPGAYHLTCYSDWMKNFDPRLYYHEDLWVTGPSKLREVVAVARDLEFYPEGGNLVAGVYNRVIVRGANGVLEPGTGSILDSGGTEVTHFTWNKSGLGAFAFVPAEGMSYSAVFELSGKKLSKPLPQADPQGSALSILEDGEGFRVVLRSSPSSRLRNQKILIVIQCKGTIEFHAEERFGDAGIVGLSIPRQELPNGIVQIAAFDETGTEIAQRLIYINSESDSLAGVILAKRTFKTREKVTVDLRLRGGRRKASASLTVVHQQASPERKMNDIRSQLLLHSDIGVERLPDNPADLDLLLATERWKRFSWDHILSENIPLPEYPLRTYQQVSGIAYADGRPMAPATHVMVFLQKKMMGYDVYVKDQGKFDIPVLFDFYGNDNLFYLVKEEGREVGNAVIRLVQDSVREFRAPRVEELRDRDGYGVFAFQKGMMDKSYFFFADKREGQDHDENPNADFEDELSGADVSVNVEDYVVFPTMEDLIREIIPSVQQRVMGGKRIVRVLLSTPQLVYTGDPLYIIDGAMTKDTEFFLGLKPADLLTVKVIKEVTKLARFGPIGQNGIILVQTRKANLAPQVIQKNTVPIEGLTRARDFPAVNYSIGGRERIPDFRSTLHWEPEVRFDEGGRAMVSFFTGDAPGRYKVFVEGITADGRPFTAQSEFEVAFNPD